MANGNSRAARSARAKLQLRDSKGRWIEMGRSRVKWYSSKAGKDLSGLALEVTPDGKNAIVQTDDGQKHAVAGKSMTIVNAKVVLPSGKSSDTDPKFQKKQADNLAPLELPTTANKEVTQAFDNAIDLIMKLDKVAPGMKKSTTDKDGAAVHYGDLVQHDKKGMGFVTGVYPSVDSAQITFANGKTQIAKNHLFSVKDKGSIVPDVEESMADDQPQNDIAPVTEEELINEAQEVSSADLTDEYLDAQPVATGIYDPESGELIAGKDIDTWYDNTGADITKEDVQDKTLDLASVMVGPLKKDPESSDAASDNADQDVEDSSESTDAPAAEEQAPAVEEEAPPVSNKIELESGDLVDGSAFTEKDLNELEPRDTLVDSEGKIVAKRLSNGNWATDDGSNITPQKALANINDATGDLAFYKDVQDAENAQLSDPVYDPTTGMVSMTMPDGSVRSLKNSLKKKFAVVARTKTGDQWEMRLAHKDYDATEMTGVTPQVFDGIKVVPVKDKEADNSSSTEESDAPEAPREEAPTNTPIDQRALELTDLDNAPEGTALEDENGYSLTKDADGNWVSSAGSPYSAKTVFDLLKEDEDKWTSTTPLGSEEESEESTEEAPQSEEPSNEEVIDWVKTLMETPLEEENSEEGPSEDTAPAQDSQENPAETVDTAPAPEVESTTVDETKVPGTDIDRTEPFALDKEKFAPTRQQQDVIDAVMAGKDTLVQAKAGSGKTSTLEAISRRIEQFRDNEQILYIAFNKSVQKEAEGRMPDNVESRTGHSLAYNWSPEWMKNRMGGGTGPNGKSKGAQAKKEALRRPDEIAAHIGLTDKLSFKSAFGEDDEMTVEEQAVEAVRAVNKYATSAEDYIGTEHLSETMSDMPDNVKSAILDAADKIWADLSAEDGKINFTFDHSRKHWALSRPDLSVDGNGNKKAAKVLFLDEAQDTPPVLAKVVADQTIQKVIVGDADQAIYGFTGAVDFLSQADHDVELPLNKSWRFGPEVADAGNRFLQMLGSKDRVVGGGPESKLVDNMEDADAILTRSNAGMINEIIRELDNDRRVGVPKNTKADLKRLFDHAADLQAGKPIKNLHEDLASFRKWEDFMEAVEKGDDPKVTMIGNLINDKGLDTLRATIDKVYDPGENGDGVFAGKAKIDPDTGIVSDAFMLNKNLKDKFGNYGMGAYGYKWNKPNLTWVPKDNSPAGIQKAISSLNAAIEEGNGVEKVDVTISTAHKAKGLEWGRVRIGDDFKGPEVDKETGQVKSMPSPEELRLAYVAVTRAESELDVGSLGWVYNYTDENGGGPDAPQKDAPTPTVEDSQDSQAEPVLPDPVEAPAADGLKSADSSVISKSDAGLAQTLTDSPVGTKLKPQGDTNKYLTYEKTGENEWQDDEGSYYEDTELSNSLNDSLSYDVDAGQAPNNNGERSGDDDSEGSPSGETEEMPAWEKELLEGTQPVEETPQAPEQNESAPTWDPGFETIDKDFVSITDFLSPDPEASAVAGPNGAKFHKNPNGSGWINDRTGDKLMASELKKLVKDSNEDWAFGPYQGQESDSTPAIDLDPPVTPEPTPAPTQNTAKKLTAKDFVAEFGEDDKGKFFKDVEGNVVHAGDSVSYYKNKNTTYDATIVSVNKGQIVVSVPETGKSHIAQPHKLTKKETDTTAPENTEDEVESSESSNAQVPTNTKLTSDTLTEEALANAPIGLAIDAEDGWNTFTKEADNSWSDESGGGLQDTDVHYMITANPHHGYSVGPIDESNTPETADYNPAQSAKLTKNLTEQQFKDMPIGSGLSIMDDAVKSNTFVKQPNGEWKAISVMGDEGKPTYPASTMKDAVGVDDYYFTPADVRPALAKYGVELYPTPTPAPDNSSSTSKTFAEGDKLNGNEITVEDIEAMEVGAGISFSPGDTNYFVKQPDGKWKLNSLKDSPTAPSYVSSVMQDSLGGSTNPGEYHAPKGDSEQSGTPINKDSLGSMGNSAFYPGTVVTSPSGEKFTKKALGWVDSNGDGVLNIDMKKKVLETDGTWTVQSSIPNNDPETKSSAAQLVPGDVLDPKKIGAVNFKKFPIGQGLNFHDGSDTFYKLDENKWGFENTPDTYTDEEVYDVMDPNPKNAVTVEPPMSPKETDTSGKDEPLADWEMELLKGYMDEELLAPVEKTSPNKTGDKLNSSDLTEEYFNSVPDGDFIKTTDDMGDAIFYKKKADNTWGAVYYLSDEETVGDDETDAEMAEKAQELYPNSPYTYVQGEKNESTIQDAGVGVVPGVPIVTGDLNEDNLNAMPIGSAIKDKWGTGPNDVDVMIKTGDNEWKFYASNGTTNAKQTMNNNEYVLNKIKAYSADDEFTYEEVGSFGGNTSTSPVPQAGNTGQYNGELIDPYNTDVDYFENFPVGDIVSTIEFDKSKLLYMKNGENSWGTVSDENATVDDAIGSLSDDYIHEIITGYPDDPATHVQGEANKLSVGSPNTQTHPADDGDSLAPEDTDVDFLKSVPVGAGIDNYSPGEDVHAYFVKTGADSWTMYNDSGGEGSTWNSVQMEDVIKTYSDEDFNYMETQNYFTPDGKKPFMSAKKSDVTDESMDAMPAGTHFKSYVEGLGVSFTMAKQENGKWKNVESTSDIEYSSSQAKSVMDLEKPTNFYNGLPPESEKGGANTSAPVEDEVDTDLSVEALNSFPTGTVVEMLSTKVTKNSDGKWESATGYGYPAESIAGTAKNLSAKNKKVTLPEGYSATPEAEILDSTGWKKLSGPGGSNPGGTFESPDGQKYYIKHSKSELHAKNEVLADKLYQMAGIDTSKLELTNYGADTLGTASKILEGATPDLKEKLNDPAYKAKLAEGFAMDAWLANWDVAGEAYDNVMTVDGAPVRVDPGGSLLFRAMGDPKGAKFGDKVTELDTLLDGSNPKSANAFSGITKEQIYDSISKVEAITPSQIDDLIDKMNFDQKDSDLLKEKLKARREDLIARKPEFYTTNYTPKKFAGADANTLQPKVKPNTDNGFVNGSGIEYVDMEANKSDPLYGTPAPVAPTAPPVEDYSNPPQVIWDTNGEWLKSVEERYNANEHKKASNVQQSGKWAKIQSVLNGEEQYIDELVTSMYLTPEMGEAAKSGIKKGIENQDEEKKNWLNKKAEYDKKVADHLAKVVEYQKAYGKWSAVNAEASGKLAPKNILPAPSTTPLTEDTDDWSKAHAGGYSLQTAIDSVKNDKALATHGLSASIDAEQIKDFDVRVQRVLNKNGQEELRFDLKVTNGWGEEMEKMMEDDSTFNKEKGVWHREYEKDSSTGLLKLIDNRKLLHATNGKTYRKEMDNGVTIDFKRAVTNPGSGYIHHTNSHNNGLSVLAPLDSTPEDIAGILKSLGIKAKPTTQKDTDLLAENRLITAFGDTKISTGKKLFDPEKNISGAERKKQLEHIQNTYNVTPADVEYVLDPTGRPQLALTREKAKELYDNSGIKEIYHDLHYSISGNMDEMAELMVGDVPGLRGGGDRHKNGINGEDSKSQSVKQDHINGAGDHAYTRISRGGYNYKSGGRVEVDGVEVFRQLDLWWNNDDKYGKKPTGSKSPYENLMNKDFDPSGSNELLVRKGIPTTMWQNVYVSNESQKSQLIQKLNAKGVVAIGGKSLDELIKVT